MKPKGLTTRAAVRRFAPLLMVALVLVTVLVASLSYTTSARESFAYDVYWPSPSSYFPGATPPNVYLRINYTGPGEGNYTYVITYTSSAGTVVAGEANVLVTGLSPFTAYASIPVQPNTGVTTTAQVYRGTASPANLVFTKTMTL